jgi:hypothetical protein
LKIRWREFSLIHGLSGRDGRDGWMRWPWCGHIVGPVNGHWRQEKETVQLVAIRGPRRETEMGIFFVRNHSSLTVEPLIFDYLIKWTWRHHCLRLQWARTVS